jgi:hypothetical protein
LIESKGGESCRLANPWPGETFVLHRWQDGQWVRAQELMGQAVTFATEAGGLYLLLPQGERPEALQPTSFTGQPNQSPKTLGKARLGMPKGF